MLRITLLIFALFFSQSFGLENMRCGTSRFAEILKNPKKKMLAKAGCNPENLYETVDSKKTQNFIIYYTKSGPHAIRSNEYIDSIASYLEQAYKLHKNTLGMKSISGAKQTYHYRQIVPDNLYPIEVIDTGLLRGEEGEFTETLGLTFSPNSNRPKETEVIIENDFAYGADCSGNPSKSHFISQGVDYYDVWKLILRATTFHELYHAFQSTYYNWQRYSTFWMEASATGVEEIGAPDANDYISYLYYEASSNFNNLGKSLDNVNEYSLAVLYLFLYSQMGSRFDSAIWNYFSIYPADNFAMQLARLADSLQKKHNFDKNAEDLFHEYAKQIFYSGNRAESSPYKPLFWVDIPEWPTWRVYKRTPPSVLQPGTIDFIRTEKEPNTAFAKKSPLQDGNSLVWALSRLLETEYVAPEPDETVKEIAAYPNPWNPRKPQTPAIHFKNLPKDFRGIEIRSSNGVLLARVDSLWEPEKKPAPGILYYRTLPYGKNKVLIVQY